MSVIRLLEFFYIIDMYNRTELNNVLYSTLLLFYTCVNLCLTFLYIIHFYEIYYQVTKFIPYVMVLGFVHNGVAYYLLTSVYTLV
jgi:hypothetical protein